MRTCRKCFEYLYLFVGGDVRCCPWNGIVVGNLLKNTLEEIWHGPKMEEIRRAFMRGELLGCNEQYCPDCINNSEDMEISAEQMKEKYDNLGNGPEYISLAYDERCNHACPSCRKSFFCPDKAYLDNLTQITKNIEPYLGSVKHIATNGIGDLFVSSEILDMISRFQPKRKDFSMFIETNGVLFKKNWSKLEHLSQFPITVSVTPNSFDKETYRYLAGRDDLELFEESMEFITSLKHEGKVARIRIIMVIQDSNFRQIPQFIRRCIEYDADDIVLRPIYKWFGLQEDEQLFKNVLNPCHPYYKEYKEIIEDPICKDSRVMNWGFDVEQEIESFPTLEMKRLCEGKNSEKEYQKVVSKCLLAVKPLIDELLSKSDRKIVIYGVGRVGRIVYEELTCGEIIVPVDGFMVEDVNKNPNYWMGCPVRKINSYDKENSIVIVALAHNNQVGVHKKLDEAGYKYIIMIDEKSEKLY